MTTKDKTGDQLMASIRKTKTEGASADKPSGATPSSAASAAPKADAPAAKPATKPASTGTAAKQPRAVKKKAAARPKTTTRSKPDSVKSGYQSPRRVWPD